MKLQEIGKWARVDKMKTPTVQMEINKKYNRKLYLVLTKGGR